MRRVVILLSCCTAALVPGLPALVAAHPLPGAPACAIFPADNPWNQRVDRLPVAKNSARMVADIGLGNPVHADFGSGLYAGEPIGIPITVVSRRTRRVPVRFMYSGESDHGRYPIPRNVKIEGGPASTGDRHVILLDRSSCRDYELWSAYPRAAGKWWYAGSGAIFNLRSDRLRPAGWTSADAAGLPILPGLARYDEVAHGGIDHALRFTAPCTAPRFVYPARHWAGQCPRSFPPMGLRVRLRANVDLNGLGPQARAVAVALERYGMILADNGSPWFVSGVPDSRWNNDDLHLLDQLRGRDFDVVDTSSLPHPGL